MKLGLHRKSIDLRNTQNEHYSAKILPCLSHSICLGHRFFTYKNSQIRFMVLEICVYIICLSLFCSVALEVKDPLIISGAGMPKIDAQPKFNSCFFVVFLPVN